MQLFRRDESAEGLHSALVGSATVMDLAHALDPEAPYVVLLDFTPIQGGWQEASIPLAPSRALLPAPVEVRRVTADVLMSTSHFTDLANDLNDLGCHIMQFRKRPRADMDFQGKRLSARVAKYRAFGLTVSIDLPHARESALIASTEPDELSAALARLNQP